MMLVKQTIHGVVYPIAAECCRSASPSLAGSHDQRAETLSSEQISPRITDLRFAAINAPINLMVRFPAGCSRKREDRRRHVGCAWVDTGQKGAGEKPASSSQTGSDEAAS